MLAGHFVVLLPLLGNGLFWFCSRCGRCRRCSCRRCSCRRCSCRRCSRRRWLCFCFLWPLSTTWLCWFLRRRRSRGGRRRGRHRYAHGQGHRGVGVGIAMIIANTVRVKLLGGSHKPSLYHFTQWRDDHNGFCAVVATPWTQPTSRTRTQTLLTNDRCALQAVKRVHRKQVTCNTGQFPGHVRSSDYVRYKLIAVKVVFWDKTGMIWLRGRRSRWCLQLYRYAHRASFGAVRCLVLSKT
jgi:hypothetical protein